MHIQCTSNRKENPSYKLSKEFVSTQPAETSAGTSNLSPGTKKFNFTLRSGYCAIDILAIPFSNSHANRG